MRRWTLLGFLLVAIGTAHADPGHSHADDAKTPSPWIDEQPSDVLAGKVTETPEVPAESSRRWRFLAAAMLGIRGDQGGLLDSGYRIVGMMGVLMQPVSISLSIDHQLGDDNRVVNSQGDAGRFSEWVASARVGRAFPIGPDFWIQIAGGVARVNTHVTRVATMNEAGHSSFGMDAVATIVWRSGLIASTLVFGITAVPSEHELVIDEMTYVVPARIEPWFGLGVALTL